MSDYFIAKGTLAIFVRVDATPSKHLFLSQIKCKCNVIRNVEGNARECFDMCALRLTV